MQTLRIVLDYNPQVADIWQSGTGLRRKSKRLDGLRLE